MRSQVLGRTDWASSGRESRIHRRFLAYWTAAHTHLEESLPPRVLTRWNIVKTVPEAEAGGSLRMVRPDT